MRFNSLTLKTLKHIKNGCAPIETIRKNFLISPMEAEREKFAHFQLKTGCCAYFSTEKADTPLKIGR
jgi:hypothetical protein